MNYVWSIEPYILLQPSIHITRVIFYAYETFIFNLAYEYLNFSYKNIFNFLTLKRLFWFLSNHFFGVSRFMFLGFLFLWRKSKSISWENYIWLKVNDTSDRRIVFFAETGELLRNGKSLDALTFVSQFTTKNNLSFPQIRELGGELNYFHEKALNLKEKATSQYSLLKVKNGFKHEVSLEIAKSEHHLSMNTDYSKAKKFNFYEKEYIIERFEGPKKETTALEIPKTELELIGPIYKKSLVNEARGSIDSSFNSSLASDRFVTTVGKMKEFDFVWKAFIHSYGIDEVEEKMLKHFLFSINEIFDWDPSK